MMDIAEIRKKAKDKANEQEPSDSAPLTDPEEVSLDHDEDVEAFVIEEPEAPGDDLPSQDLPASLESSSGLERLFTSVENLSLATEEEYQDVLKGDGQLESDTRQYLAFNLGQEEYALDIIQISEIIKVREFTDIPRVPDFILGIISLRGVVVPVLDLNKRFRLGETNMTAASRIVVCQSGELVAGLLVDSINQVISLEQDRIEPPPAVLTGLDRELVEGVGRFQGRMIIILHLESVINVELT